MAININNLTAVAFDEKFLKKIVKIVLKNERQEEKELSLAFIGEERMRELNGRYRNKNKVTDVLSFGKNKKFPFFPDEKAELGEIIICSQAVKKNAKKYNLSFEKELARVLIHGVLHLLGYDHEKSGREAEKMRRMRRKEEYYLSKLKDY